jgi:lipopolysaccharide/colanic/teichoic acid biosynthesis glycosyltransferase
MPDSIASPWITAFSSSPSPIPLESSLLADGRLQASAFAGRSRTRRRRSAAGRSLQNREWRRVRRPDTPASTLAAVPEPVLTEAIFTSALSRERKRADRLEEQFALITMECEPRDVDAVAEAAGAAAPDHSILGWLIEDRELGLILTDLPKGPNHDIVRRTQQAVLVEVVKRAGIGAAERLRSTSYIHAGPVVVGAPRLADGDPLLDDLQAAAARRPIYLATKRALDLAGALLLLALFAPLIAVIAALVRFTSPGPVFFRQERVGLLARPFTMLKFRTMVTDNDPALHEKFVSEFITKSGTHVAAKASDAPFKIKADPRVTAVGRLLRRTSLDEVPQLWNVVRGEMSLVGPRPPIGYELARYQPCMTGLWQVIGRSRTTFDEMVRMDVSYARNRSLLMDLRILLATPRAMFSGKGAY